MNILHHQQQRKKLTYYHECEFKSSLHRLPVNLIWKICKPHISFKVLLLLRQEIFREEKKKLKEKLVTSYFACLFFLVTYTFTSFSHFEKGAIYPTSQQPKLSTSKTVQWTATINKKNWFVFDWIAKRLAQKVSYANGILSKYNYHIMTAQAPERTSTNRLK